MCWRECLDIMGNCLKSPNADDISLLRGGGGRAGSSSSSGGGGGGGDVEVTRETSSSASSADLLQQSGIEGSSMATPLGPPPPYQEMAPVFYSSSNVGRPSSLLTEEEQRKIAQSIGMITHLPTGTFDGSKKNRECVICMVDFAIGDPIRFLPCMHIYHTSCIDDWLMRSFTCPSCMEPVDAALLTTYESN